MVELKNTLYLQVKYASIISNKLEKFKIKKHSPFLANCKCPFCETGTKTRKSRGYLIQRQSDIYFYCHNCFQSLSLINFLKQIDLQLHNQFWFEVYKDQGEQPEAVEETKPATPVFLPQKSPLKALKKVSQLAHDHPVKEYVLKRQIPNFFHSQLYYAPKYVEWVNSVIPGKLDSTEHPRLVIPFFDEDKACFGFQGRAFSKAQIRYITIMLDENRPKCFGLDRVNFEEKVRVVEGPIDSMFLSNCIALAGAVGSLELPRNTQFIFDNEPRNSNIVKQMEKRIEEGFSVCIWPKKITQKDINDCVMKGGWDPKELQNILDLNSYKGLIAKAKLSEWRRA